MTAAERTPPIALRVADRAPDAAAVAPDTGPAAVRVHPDDDVAVAVRPQAAGTEIVVEGARVTLAEDVPAGHKFALRALAAGESVMKYGLPIGAVTEAVEPGTWLHAHNLRTRLSGTLEYRWSDERSALSAEKSDSALQR